MELQELKGILSSEFEMEGLEKAKIIFLGAWKSLEIDNGVNFLNQPTSIFYLEKIQRGLCSAKAVKVPLVTHTHWMKWAEFAIMCQESRTYLRNDTILSTLSINSPDFILGFFGLFQKASYQWRCIPYL